MTKRWRRTSAAPKSVPCAGIDTGQRRPRVDHERPHDLDPVPEAPQGLDHPGRDAILHLEDAGPARAKP